MAVARLHNSIHPSIPSPWKWLRCNVRGRHRRREKNSARSWPWDEDKVEYPSTPDRQPASSSSLRAPPVLLYRQSTSASPPASGICTYISYMTNEAALISGKSRRLKRAVTVDEVLNIAQIPFLSPVRSLILLFPSTPLFSPFPLTTPVVINRNLRDTPLNHNVCTQEYRNQGYRAVLPVSGGLLCACIHSCI